MEIDAKFLKKLIFIYNCLNDGWGVKKVNHNTYFQKIMNGIKKYLKKYLREFVNKNLELKNE